MIEKSLLLRYKEWLMQNYAVSSVNSMLVSLNQLLEYLGGRIFETKKGKGTKTKTLQMKIKKCQRKNT